MINYRKNKKYKVSRSHDELNILLDDLGEKIYKLETSLEEILKEYEVVLKEIQNHK